MPDRTIESFGKELMDLITIATHREVTVRVPTKSEAISLRYRLYHLRAKLRVAQEPHLRGLAKTQFFLYMNGKRFNYSRGGEKFIPQDAVWEVRCGPADSDLGQYIKTAIEGIDVNALNPPTAMPDIGNLVSTPDEVRTLPDDDSENNS